MLRNNQMIYVYKEQGINHYTESNDFLIDVLNRKLTIKT